MIIQVLIITTLLLLIAFSGLAIRLILKKNGEFSGGNCSGSAALNDKGYSCGCGENNCGK